MDCLFIHVPQRFGNYLAILKMPLGLPALCWQVKQSGFSSSILHLAVEELADKAFRIEELIKERAVKAVCLDLHWHHQSFSVLDTARKIKDAVPDCSIILGGFTASLFAREIIADFPQVDYVIKGDAEAPLPRLLQAVIKDKRPPRDIPNLVWREASAIRENPFDYVVDPQTFDRLEFFHLDLVEHHEIYDRIHDHENRLMKTPVEKIMGSPSFAYYNPGRGCLVDCAYCGGGCYAQRQINQRRGLVIKSLPGALKDIAGFIAFGIQNLYLCFDPLPARSFYLELFSSVRQQKLSLNLHFECWTLPDTAFLDAFKDSFGPGSRLIISPDSGSEKVRKLNKGYFFANAELLSTLDQMFEKKIPGQVYFSAGFPQETAEDAEETFSLIKLIKQKYQGFFRISFMLIELDPGSLMWFTPERCGIRSKRRNFKDLYLAHQQVPSLGYRSETLSNKELIDLRRRIKAEIGPALG